MLVNAVMFSTVVTAIHIIAVVLAFGLVVIWPLVVAGVERADPRGLAALHRTRRYLGHLIVNPALVLLLISGIYLASDLHDWKHFFTQWGLAMVVILGGLEGAGVSRQEGKLARLAEADANAASSSHSAEYTRLRTRTDVVSWAMAALVIVTIYFMTAQTGG
jgi:hypothetical protein